MPRGWAGTVPKSPIFLRLARKAPLHLFVGLALLCAAFWLGHYVVTHREPPALMAFARQVRGEAVPEAWAITHAGFWYVLAPLYLLMVVAAALYPAQRVPLLYAVICGIVAWGAASGFQHLFARPRRGDWLVRHETAFSYPSSHAAIATAFYFICALLVLRSRATVGVRCAGFCLLSALAFAIVWSRLALAAHYVTDVIGGIVLGLAVAAALGYPFAIAQAVQDDKAKVTREA